MQNIKSLSVVIPIYNEEDNIPQLHSRLHTIIDTLEGFKAEIIFVDDGSTDDSLKILETIYQKDNHVKIIQLSRNFGHHLAITAGLDYAVGDIVILMDGDLQNRPEDIPALIKKIDEGYDIVYTVRKDRHDPVFKKITSRLFLGLMKRVVREPMAIGTSVFRAMRRSVIDSMKQLRERNRYIVGLIDWMGFKQASIEVDHDRRFAGKTKYSFGKQIRLAFDAVFSFSDLPLRLASIFGFIITGFAFGYGAYIIIRKLLWGFTLPGFASLTVSIFFLGGVQLIVLGIVGSYIGRIYTEVKGRPLYVVKKEWNRN